MTATKTKTSNGTEPSHIPLDEKLEQFRKENNCTFQAVLFTEDGSQVTLQTALRGTSFQSGWFLKIVPIDG